MTPRPSTRDSAEGASVVELLVALTVVLALTGAALGLSLSSRELYETDQARTRLNQGLRASIDFLSNDVRQAGERLGADFPSLEIENGTDGAPDRITVRRNLSGTVMKLCGEIEGTDQDVPIGQLVLPVPGCKQVLDDDGDGWPENLQAWREYRLAQGGTARAYLYDPVHARGQFFDYIGEDAGQLRILAGPDTTWTDSYDVLDQCRIYLLEERVYHVEEGLLRLAVNGEEPESLVDGVENLQAVAVFRDGTQQESFGVVDEWGDLRAVQVEIEGKIGLRDFDLERAWSTRILPRNVLSQ